MTSIKYPSPSYKEILEYIPRHNDGIKKVNTLIKKSQTRFSLSVFDEEYDNLPKWCFGIVDNNKWIQIQCINCHICGEYIDSLFNLPTKIYCSDLTHHNLVEKKIEFFISKKI